MTNNTPPEQDSDGGFATTFLYQGTLFKMEDVHISEICIGDTVILDQEVRTVGRESFGYSSFMGLSLFGDTFNLGNKLVSRAVTGHGGRLVVAGDEYHD